MDIFITVVALTILAETSFLVWQNKIPRRGAKRKIYIDTSSLIDGRILNVARTGFIDGDIIILKSVLRELHLLADGKDSEKRAKARAGLESVAELERIVEVNTSIYDDGDERVKVDEELLKYAKENRGTILTMDYNLIKVATAEGIPTLNINELALAVRIEFEVGERMEIKITEKGANRGQGVGHLPNGVMLVVDKAANKIGQTVMVEFTHFHETPAGRIVFGRIVAPNKNSDK
ncbi:TRAM domain-containing protein [Candidatus Saccharibacteria bacterium]|nr:TRAM domain-containing protein [Candidatus Saccharibacteria bacterium]